MEKILKERTLFFIVIAMGLFGAFFSVGFFHPDEHYSTIELMNFRNGFGDPAFFNWDINEKIRSFTQPFFYFVITRIFSFVHISDPFFLGFIFRLIGFFMGSASLYYLCHSLKDHFPTKQAFLFTLLTWFVPFLFLRTSSENFSTIFMLITMAIILKAELKSSHLILAGACAALSFSFRFQMAFALLGLFAWMIFIPRLKIKDLTFFVTSFLLIYALCLLIDFYGYRGPTFTAYNYLRENILNNRVSEFGTHPIWFYFIKPLIKGIPPISIVFMLAFFTFCYHYPKSLLTFVSLPFLFIHLLIGHKEVRFLYFIYALLPLMTFILMQNLKWREMKPFKYFKNFCYGLNALVLLYALLTPAHGPINMYDYLYHEFNEAHPLYTFKASDNTALTASLPFYQKKELRFTPIGQELFFANLTLANHSLFLITSKYKEYETLITHPECKMLHSLYSKFLLDKNYFNFRARSSIWAVWECSPVRVSTL